MTYAFLFLACVAFIELFLFLDLGEQARGIVLDCRRAFGVLASSDLGDDEKEAYVRKASLGLLRATAAFTLKFLVIGAVLYAGYRSALALFPDMGAPLARSLVSPVVVLATMVAAGGYLWVRDAVRKQL